MRFSLAFAIVVLACVLGAIQVAASVALRESAVAPSWVRAVPSAFETRVDTLRPSLPMPQALRLVLARRALVRGDLSYASRATALLAPSRDRFALEAEIALRRGDRAGALAAYLAAGDLAGVEAAIARLQAEHHPARAVALSEEVVARLERDRTQADALAQAYYDLGGARETRAYAIPPGLPARRVVEESALRAYERASALAPLSVRYLIAVANQRINLGDIAGARTIFERARSVDPTSAEPLTGLGDVAFRSGDRALAEAMLARARALEPGSAAVRRLATELHP